LRSFKTPPSAAVLRAAKVRHINPLDEE
jgi:hypothetical protein